MHRVAVVGEVAGPGLDRCSSSLAGSVTERAFLCRIWKSGSSGSDERSSLSRLAIAWAAANWSKVPLRTDG
jgi:hypothetical protein